MSSSVANLPQRRIEPFLPVPSSSVIPIAPNLIIYLEASGVLPAMSVTIPYLRSPHAAYALPPWVNKPSCGPIHSNISEQETTVYSRPEITTTPWLKFCIIRSTHDRMPLGWLFDTFLMMHISFFI